MVVGAIILVGIGLFSSFGNSTSYLQAARLGGDYLVAHTDTDGSFVYQYNPVTRKTSSSYNIVRHAGTTYSLLELFEATGEPTYLLAADRALNYLAESAVVCPGMPDAMCIAEDNETKLGGNALAVLAFTKYISLTQSSTTAALIGDDGVRDYLPLAQKLARFITDTQAPDGEFVVHKIATDTGARTAFESEYYPGEAIFALARLYEIDGTKEWIDAAHSGARWLIEVRDAYVATQNLNHDHWLLYGLNELYANRPEEIYLSHAQRIVQSIVAAQHSGKTGEQKEWNGGFYNPPRSTPTATRSEGLGAAYQLFIQAGDLAYASVALDAMEKAIVFQLRTQLTPKKARSMQADPAGIGGFFESLDEYDIRIDYVQHNISALLAFDRINKSHTTQ